MISASRVVRWRCITCGCAFTRILPRPEALRRPDYCPGCHAKTGKASSDGLRRDRRQIKLHG
jgi:hypothetical protein